MQIYIPLQQSTYKKSDEALSTVSNSLLLQHSMKQQLNVYIVTCFSLKPPLCCLLNQIAHLQEKLRPGDVN